MALRAEARPAGGAQELPVCSSEGRDHVRAAPRASVPSLAWHWAGAGASLFQESSWKTIQEQGDGGREHPQGSQEPLALLPRIQ